MLFDSIKHFLSKTVKDSYGRDVGQLICINPNTKNEVVSLELKLGDNSFAQFPVSHFKLEGNQLIFLYKWMIDSEDLIKEFTLLTKRMEALEGLLSKGEVSKEVYDELNNAFLKQYDGLKEKQETLIRELSKNLEDVTNSIKELNMALAVVKMQRILKEIDEETFKNISSIIQTGISRAIAERRDLEQVIQRVKSLSTPKPIQHPVIESKQLESGSKQPLTVQVVD